MKVTKATAAAITVATLALSATAAYASHVFTDVEDDRFYAAAVAWADENGITTGCGAGTTFCPEDPVTRGENITFAKRYDDNIVQPALGNFDNRLDALEASDGIEHGEIVLTHGTDTVTANDANPPSTVSNFVGGAEISGDGAVQEPLIGPRFVSGVEYGLRSIEYCIADLGPTTSVERVIVYDNQGLPFGDPTDRTEPGCYVVEVNVSGFQGATVLWDIAGGGALRLQGFTSTWAPLADGGFTALAESAGSPPPDPFRGP